ncbi:unnamed protein product [Arctogadus glacialis]
MLGQENKRYGVVQSTMSTSSIHPPLCWNTPPSVATLIGGHSGARVMLVDQGRLRHSKRCFRSRDLKHLFECLSLPQSLFMWT